MSQVATAERHADDVQKPASGISLRVVFNAIRRHPIAFLGVILLAVSTGLAIWFFLPLPKRTAAVVFHVSPHSQTLLAAGPSNGADFSSYKLSQIALIKSRRILSSVLKDPDVKMLEMIGTAEPDALTWLDKQVKVDQKIGPEHIRVIIEGDDSRELMVLLSALQKEYLTASTTRDTAALSGRLALLEKNHKDIDLAIKDEQKVIAKLRLSVGGPDGLYQFLNDQYHYEEYKKAFNAYELLGDRIRASDQELKTAKKYVAELRDAASRPPLMAVMGTLSQNFSSTPSVPRAAIESALQNDPGMQELEAAVSRARDLVFKIEEIAPGGKSAAHERAYQALKTAEESRDKYRIDKKPVVEARLKEGAMLSAELHLDKMQSDFTRTVAEQHQALGKVKEQKEKLDGLSKNKIELAERQAVIEHKEQLAKQMAKDIEKVSLDKKTLADRVTVADEPFVIQGIDGNRRLKYAMMAASGTFVLGFGGLVMWEHRSRRVTRTEEVSTELGTRLIGTIPPLAAGGGVPASHEANTPMIEAIDTARIMLTHAGKEGSRLRVLMVTSAVSGEGKTTLSGNLAISLTRAGFRTLLIDGDMQAPSAHLLFGLPDAPGLSELLRGESDLKRAVRQSPIPGLSILPAGRWNMSTRQSLVGDKWRILKQQLESEFDFVVIDTSPLLMVSDAMLLAREADGVVLSVLLGVSQIARVAETVNRLHAIGAELAGVVVNNVQSEVYRRYMSRSKYASPAPVAAEFDKVAPDAADRAETTEPLAEEIGVETATTTKEG